MGINKEYFAIGRKDGKEYVQISREVDGLRVRTDPIEIPWKPEYRTMVLEVTDDKFKEYSETESLRYLTDCEDIVLDKRKYKPYTVDHNDPEFKKFIDFCRYGDCNQNAHDDAVDALRYISKKWMKEHDIIGKVTTVEQTKDGLKFTIEKEKPMKTKKDIDRIVITKNDLNEVLLRAYSGDEIVEKTIAKCSPDDIFDFNIGAKLAVDRLYDGYDMTPKPKRKLYNGEIFVRSNPIVNFVLNERKLKNQVYKVNNGSVKIGCVLVNGIYEDMTDKDLNRLFHSPATMGLLFSDWCEQIIDGYFVR